MTSDPTSADPRATKLAVRYRCTACGNLTRFDVTTTSRTRAFHHYSIGGELTIEDEVVLAAEIESVVCRWCNNASSVIELTPAEQDNLAADVGSEPEG